MLPNTESAATTVNSLLDHGRASSLGTIASDGGPFVSLVNVARFSKTSLVMLLSGLAQHTRNLRNDRRCSLLITDELKSSADPLTAARVSLTGSVTMLSRAEDQAERDCLLKRHPDAAMYADLGDFAIFKFEIKEAHLVAGFGRIQTMSADKL